ncbi:GIY-YIG nuclease family protein [Rhizobiales bacterium TNE-4]|nr:GIY-YIG nuclease family protein [Rhizobiales bacterium TNE-4]MBV1826328.1 GIY-YIG nuclease family protein [Rhizobiales bacterium TNE-4]
MGKWVYILLCSDKSYYVGSTHNEPETRLSEHNAGLDVKAYTYSRRPVALIYAEYFDEIIDAISLERQLKGWSRAKKEAFMREDFSGLQMLAKRKILKRNPHPSS